MSRSRIPAYAAACAVILAGLLLFAGGPARGQDEGQGNQDAGLRAVSGEVLDKAEKPINEAIVYLKNARTLTVRTYFSNSQGVYRFSGLDPNVDYEIHAEFGDLTSSSRVVSSFDNRKEIRVVLKVDREKKKEK